MTTADPAPRHGPDRSALGHRLRTRRRGAGMSQRDLASQVSYSRSSVAHAESGTDVATLPGRQFWQRCDEVLDADGALLDGYDRIAAARRATEAGSNAAAPWRWGDRSAGGPPRADGGGPEHGTSGAGLSEPGETVPAGVLPPGVSALGRADGPGRDLALALPAAGGPPDVEAWEGRADRHVASVGVRPPPALREDVVADLAEVGSFLGVPLPQTESQRMAVVVARLCLVAANAELSCGRPRAARRWLRTAERAAGSAQDVLLSAFAAAQEAWLSFDVGEAARAALSAAAACLGRFGRVRCAGTAEAFALQAEASAAAGETDRARESLDALHELVGRLPCTVTAAPGNWLSFPPGRLRHVESAVLAWLGDVPGARAAGDAALAAYDASHVRARAQVDLSQAVARSRSGDVAGGVSTAFRTLDTVPRWVADDALVRAVVGRMLATPPTSRHSDEHVRRLHDRVGTQWAA